MISLKHLLLRPLLLLILLKVLAQWVVDGRAQPARFSFEVRAKAELYIRYFPGESFPPGEFAGEFA